MSPSKRSTFSSSFVLSAEIPDGLEVAVNPTLFERGQFDPAVRQARFLGQTACSFLFSSFQCSRTSSINSLRQHRKTPHAVSPSFLLRVLPRLCAITAIGYTPLFQRLRVLSLRYLRLTGLECTADELLDFLRAHNLLQVALIVVNIWDEDGEGWREILAAIRDENLIEMLEMIGCHQRWRFSGFVTTHSRLDDHDQWPCHCSRGRGRWKSPLISSFLSFSSLLFLFFVFVSFLPFFFFSSHFFLFLLVSFLLLSLFFFFFFSSFLLFLLFLLFLPFSPSRSEIFLPPT